jgi:hypothetical protein
MLGFLALISLITWLGPEQSGSPTLSGWAELIVWMLFILPIVPAVSAGAERIRGRKKWSPIIFGAIFGLIAPILGLVSLATIFVLLGFNLDLGSPYDRLPDSVILAALFSVTVALGIATARRKR